MTSFRAAVAFAALLIASVPAVGLRIAEWSIDPRAELDEGQLVERLQEILSSEEIGIPPDFPSRIRVEIDVYHGAGGLDLIVTSSDLEAERALTSTVRTARRHQTRHGRRRTGRRPRVPAGGARRLPAADLPSTRHHRRDRRWKDCRVAPDRRPGYRRLAARGGIRVRVRGTDPGPRRARRRRQRAADRRVRRTGAALRADRGHPGIVAAGGTPVRRHGPTGDRPHQLDP